MNSQISFNAEISVSILSHDNRRWLTAEDVGRCLGFGKGKERQGIINAHNRHIDEFTEEDTCVIKLMTRGQMREFRIFSETGCIKLGFFSNTPTAKQFRKWAAKVLSGSLNADASSEQIIALKAAYLHSNPETQKLLRYIDMGLSHVETGKLLNCSGQTVRDRLKKLSQLGLSNYQPNAEMSGRGKKGNEVKRQAIAFAQAQTALPLEG